MISRPWIKFEMAFQDGGLLNVLPVQRMNFIQVDSVQRWMDDLTLMTECECMCILQSKPISTEDDSQSELMFTSQDSTQSSLEMLLKRAWIISTELTKIVQKLEKNKWKRVHVMTVRMNCHVRSMIKEYNTFTKTSTDEMHRYETILMDKCSELTDITERCTQTGEEETLLSMKMSINETLTSVGEYFSHLINLALKQEVKNLIEQLDTCDNLYSVESAIHRLYSLTREGSRLCQLVAQEGGVVALFKICRQDCFKCLYPSALRTLASVCCVEEGIYQLEKVVDALMPPYQEPVGSSYPEPSLEERGQDCPLTSVAVPTDSGGSYRRQRAFLLKSRGSLGLTRVDGILCLTDILTDDSQTEASRAEAAAVIAQITSPHLTFTQHLSSFIENMEEIVTALLKLCEEASSGEVCLLATAALANITFLDTLSCEMLLPMNAIKILLNACSDRQRVNSSYARDQIVTILANMSIPDQCASEIIKENGVQILIEMLFEKSATGILADISACERVQQKSAVTLARLSRDPEVAKAAIKYNCIPRLIELCRFPEERHNSDAVLVACLAALRRLAITSPEDLEESDFEQLVKPRLVDSFLLCSNMEESFV